MPNRPYASRPLTSIVIAGAALLLFSCQSPLEKPDTASDLIEFESVWQYLKAFSIHQDAVPPDPFVFSSTVTLMKSVNDTLKGHNYTEYYVERTGAAAAWAGGTSASAGYTQTVFFDQLTASTACLTITLFDDWSWDDFQTVADSLAGFPNIVIDIRHNLGGRLDVLDSIIEALIPAGTPYIVARFRGFDGTTKKYATYDWDTLTTEKGPMPGFENKKYAVIIDTFSASASEILAAAIFEGSPGTGKAKLIGERSFGKGIGQIILERRTRKPLQITFLEIKGASDRIGDYHRKGIAADTVPSWAVDTAWTRWQKEIFYAVKTLEPGATISSIGQFPPVRIQTLRVSPASSGCYKVIKEEDLRM